MKKKLIFFLPCFLVLFFIEMSTAEEFSFRKTNWGMSIEEVKSSETLKIVVENDKFLAYRTNLIGNDVIVAYGFIENQLVIAQYLFGDNHVNGNDYITDYNNLREMLTKKYGKPKRDEIIWEDDRYKDKNSRWGTALLNGDMVFLSIWETSTTDICFLMREDNFSIFRIIEYSSKNLKKLKK